MEAMNVKQFKGNIVEINTKSGVRLYYYDDCLAHISRGVLTLNSDIDVYSRTAVKYLNIWLEYWGDGIKYKDIKDTALRYDFDKVRC